MESIRKILLLVTVLALLSSGCHRNTTVIIPPDSRPDNPTLIPTEATNPTAPATETTISPTNDSTAPPTEAPTVSPTEVPTVPPTEVPTVSPTEVPTVPPTEAPTVPPTEAPTPPPTDAPTTPPATEPPLSSTDAYVNDILSALNSVRRGQGLSSLTLSGTLSDLAELRANELSLSFSSIRPDGRDWSSVLSDWGHDPADATGEIRGKTSAGFPADILVDTWMHTDSSKTCILSSFANRCGIGIIHSAGQVYMIVIFMK